MIVCHSYCSQCTGALSNQCSACASSYYYQASSTSCLTSCPSNTYLSSGICEPCGNTCLTCNGSGNSACISCGSPRFLKGTQCITSCGTGFYGKTSTRTCEGKTISKNVACDGSCYNCSGELPNQCTQCTGSLYLTPSSTCSSTCPSNYYKEASNNQCISKFTDLL